MEAVIFRLGAVDGLKRYNYNVQPMLQDSFSLKAVSAKPTMAIQTSTR